MFYQIVVSISDIDMTVKLCLYFAKEGGKGLTDVLAFLLSLSAGLSVGVSFLFISNWFLVRTRNQENALLQERIEQMVNTEPPVSETSPF